MKAVEALRGRFGIAPILKVLGAAASTYYGWLARQRDPSQRRRADAEPLEQIREIHDRSEALTALRGYTRPCAAASHASGSSG